MRGSLTAATYPGTLTANALWATPFWLIVSSSGRWCECIGINFSASSLVMETELDGEALLRNALITPDVPFVPGSI